MRGRLGQLARLKVEEVSPGKPNMRPRVLFRAKRSLKVERMPIRALYSFIRKGKDRAGCRAKARVRTA